MGDSTTPKKNKGFRRFEFKLRFGFQQHMAMLFSALVLVTGLTLALAGYRMVAETVISANDKLVHQVTEKVMAQAVHGARRPVQLFVDTMAKGALIEAHTLDERLAYLRPIRAILDAYPLVDSIVFGYDNGDFLEARLLSANANPNCPEAPDESALAVFSIEADKNGKRTGECLFFDDELRLLLRSSRTANYDPRTRPWYREAMQTDGLILTQPYSHPSSGQTITAFARKNHDGNAAVGIITNLSQLSDMLARNLPSKASHLVLLRSDGTLVAADDGIVVREKSGAVRPRTSDDLPAVIKRGMEAYQIGLRGKGIDINDGQRDWTLTLEESGAGDDINSVMLLAIPKDETLANAVIFLRHTILIMAGILILSIPLVWIVAKRVSSPLRMLTDKVQRIQQFCFEERGHPIDSGIEEIQALADGIDRMRDNTAKFLAITQAISVERNFDVLLESVLNKILEVTDVDGGTLALLSNNGGLLKDSRVCWIKEREMQCAPVSHEELESTLPIGEALLNGTAVRTAIERANRNGAADFLTPGFADAHIARIDAICIPLRDRMGERLGVLALFKAVRPGGAGLQAQQVSFIEAAASTAAIALENQSLIEAQRELRDALIHILAGAIDAKSPDTGGHCQRVPVLFQMLLHAACDTREGPLKDFTLNEDGWEEAKLAGWLHDCGKITTPEYVMDKATKLETLYDRIHEVRTRFEVLKRDAEIASLRALLDGADAADEQRKLNEALRALDDDFAFVAACNAGGESMSDTAVERLAAIGGRTWLRTLDKQLGVSRAERARMDRTTAPALPVLESLLMDCPEHIVERGEKDFIPTGGDQRFTIKTPSALYNRGELYNLRIQRGTLTEEERYKINDHITQTILMLEQLPLPRHLRNVPDIAASHHETMDGKGYPRGLKREDMSWSARMMAIADIFEALTASDRPYKSSKTLSEALKIMDGFKARNHIDPDLYELFLQSDIPQRYAAQHLPPEQNDLHESTASAAPERSAA